MTSLETPDAFDVGHDYLRALTEACLKSLEENSKTIQGMNKMLEEKDKLIEKKDKMIEEKRKMTEEQKEMMEILEQENRTLVRAAESRKRQLAGQLPEPINVGPTPVPATPAAPTHDALT